MLQCAYGSLVASRRRQLAHFKEACIFYFLKPHKTVNGSNSFPCCSSCIITTPQHAHLHLQLHIKMITSHESSSILHREPGEQQEEQHSSFPAACLCLDDHNNAVAVLSAAPCGLTAALAMQIEAHSLPPPPFPTTSLHPHLISFLQTSAACTHAVKGMGKNARERAS